MNVVSICNVYLCYDKISIIIFDYMLEPGVHDILVRNLTIERSDWDLANTKVSLEMKHRRENLNVGRGYCRHQMNQFMT